MYKYHAKFTDFNGVEREQDFYFNLTEAELAKLQLHTPGGFTETVRAIIDAKDQPSLIKIFEELIDMSYGVKTADGGFIKRQSDLENFKATQAYSDFYMHLASDDGASADFVRGLVPANLAKKLPADADALMRGDLSALAPAT